jgi:hypothetical protein
LEEAIRVYAVDVGDVPPYVLDACECRESESGDEERK